MPSCVSVAEPEKLMVSPTFQVRVERGAVIVAIGYGVVDHDRHGLGVRSAVGVGHAQSDRVAADRRESVARLRRGRVAEDSVPVQVPGVRESLRRIGIGRTAPVELNRQRRLAGQRVGRDDRGRQEVLDPVDLASIDVHVEKVPSRPGDELDRTARASDEGLPVGGVRVPVCVGEHRPDALSGVIGEKEGVLVVRRVDVSGVEGQPGDRGAPGGAAFPRHDLGAVVVGINRRRDCSGFGVEVLADVEIQVVVARLVTYSFVAGPAEIGQTPTYRRSG